ncbi:MAG: glucose-6-phosphate isomerase [Candidatus Omnitrophica bacterium]|nr:glucose-6-phosphate isomerase [Candidatus Omnitrophota bacterium]
MKEIRFDFNNMFSPNIRILHGVGESELKAMSPVLEQARRHLLGLTKDRLSRICLGLEWIELPFQSKQEIARIEALAREISQKFENVIFLGIGGSFLGLKAAQDALSPPYYNDFPGLRKGRPRIYFEGNNLDPDTLGVLLKNLDPKKTFVVVISKSGETTETKAALSVVESWLKKNAGKFFGRQILAVTDPENGTLRKRVNLENGKDKLSFRSLELKKGVGGRYSELNMGLLHLAITGIDIQELFKGAEDMIGRCKSAVLFENPALMYAALQTILYRKKGKSIAILMPFSETLKSTADWYVQLLAESLGKKYARKIKKDSKAREAWEPDKKHIVNVGRTPIAARGTNDLHSIQQNNIEGENNKTITFIKVERFCQELELANTGDLLAGKKFSELLSLAEEATEWALVRNDRPNCAITLPAVNPYYWGGLILFFELACAYEGELLNVNAFNQPGVEGYKNYMYYKLKKQGLPKEVAQEIKKRPLSKNPRFII